MPPWGVAIAAREGELADNSIGNRIIKNNQVFTFRGVNVEGDTKLGDNSGDKLALNADVTTHIIPDIGSNYNLGSDSQRWGTVYVDTIVGACVSGGVSQISVGNGLSVSPSSGTGSVELNLILATNKGLIADSNGLCVSISSGLSFDENGAIKAVGTVAAGVCQITNTAGGLNLSANTGLVDIGLSTGQGMSIAADNSLVTVLSSGLDFDTSGGLSVQLGRWFNI